MACPFFVPLEIVNDGSWPHPARLPLGAGWNGQCCASGEAAVPDDSAIREFCNLGYATTCPRLPQRADWDAVRFSVAGAGNAQIALWYTCELHHAPIQHGKITFDVPSQTWLDAPGDARVRRLAECYLQTYRTRQPFTIIESTLPNPQRNP